MKLQALAGDVIAAHAPHALVIDGDPAGAAAVAAALDECGVATCAWVAGVGGLRSLAEDEVDLVVIDVEQPDVSGWELLRRVRRMTAAPVLVLSARASDVDVARGLALGADDYVRKPFSPIELEARAHALLRRAAAAAPAAPRAAAV